MEHGNVILRFDSVSFEYEEDKPILDEASFSVRERAKVTIMGQNGAGKSTLFALITGALKPKSGRVSITNHATIGIAPQVIPRTEGEKTILEYFAGAFHEQKYNLEKLTKEVLDAVNLAIPLERKIKECSGGQQARLLLAYALIQHPDILLLDEPTNNLDADGIEHLTGFLMTYDKTVIVISHDAAFLNSFTDGVLNLDVRTKKVEQYVGDYFDVVEQIKAQIEREERKNAQLLRNIQDRKDKVNFFAHKGGKMRKLASKLREEVAEDEENMVEVKCDDKTIGSFTIPAQEWSESVAHITSVAVMHNHTWTEQPVDITLWRRDRLIIKGPNGIGKSTLLKTLASTARDIVSPERNSAKPNGVEGPSTCLSNNGITPGVVVGYYRQDFSGLDFEKTVYDSLKEVMTKEDNELVYATGARFLLTGDLMCNTVASLSEGQKGLLCYARFVLQKPGLLILDEPSNHINFRHLPAIARAIDAFQGAVILVSHMPEFVSEIRTTQELDLSLM